MINSLNLINQTNFNISNFKEIFNKIFNETIRILKIQETIELSLIIVDEKTQLELNQKYRNKKYIADVLTFYLDKNDSDKILNLTNIKELGDIFICYSKAITQAKAYNHSLKREFAFLFLHGFLHSLGYDHIKPNEEKDMDDLQNKILNNLNILRK